MLNVIGKFSRHYQLVPYTAGEFILKNLSTLVSEDSSNMNLNEVVCRLKRFAPLTLAEDWDNVGLLVEPSAPHKVKRLLLTNDLTIPVMNEAIQMKADMILSYHPPLFQKFKRLLQSDWKQRVAIKCIENRIAVYSPHTSYDALLNGVNDWLISPFKGSTVPIQGAKTVPTDYVIQTKLVTEKAIQEIQEFNRSGLITIVHSEIKDGTMFYRLHCSNDILHKVNAILAKDGEDIEVIEQVKFPSAVEGSGRLATLDTPVTLQEAVRAVKKHLKLSHVRLAMAIKDNMESKIKSVAVCAGSGSSVLNGVNADLYVTGEMSHHEVLQCTHSGRNVILCEHSNTERGFLTEVLQDRLSVVLGDDVRISVSTTDRDPLQIV